MLLLMIIYSDHPFKYKAYYSSMITLFMFFFHKYLTSEKYFFAASYNCNTLILWKFQQFKVSTENFQNFWT